MGRRTLLLIAALVVAALGTSLVFLYVNGADQRAQARLDLVTGLVATDAIAAGTTGAAAQQAGLFEQRRFTRESVPAEELVSDPADIASQVALATIAAGQPILRGNFGEATVAGVPLADGRLAVSVELSDPARVAGLVQPGSEVAVFLSGPDAIADRPASQGGAGPFTGVLLPRVEVVNVGPPGTSTTADTGEQTAGEDIPRTILTLALTQEEASKVIYGADQGSLYFGLLNEDSATEPGRFVGPENLFD